MKSTTIAALAAFLSAGAQAVPTVHGHVHAGHHAHAHLDKRDIVWITEFEIETVTVMETVYADGPQPTGTPGPQTGYASPVAVTSTAYAAAPTTTSALPAYVPPSQAPAPVPSSSSVAPPAPQPTTLTTTTTTAAPVYQAPPAAPTTTAAAPATTAAAAPASGAGTYSGDGSTNAGASYSGDVTYYEPGLGACGVTSVSTDHIVAISEHMFDPLTPAGNPNNNPLCNRVVQITGLDGTTYPATVVDRCVGCALSDLDLTETLFNIVTNNGDGRVHNMKWSWT
ncbi:hypothetical protein ANO11243_002150 [Dothideomycetidae sp. 11243]|nr:hypothetical protein ANO11243_002150 [fungal sp. No.11243]